ncbi:MAG: helix-turn-helix domain-containing protein [Prevotella sp.]|nr:helix-turn-helix domain-containing protein [Prevotella sp.]
MELSALTATLITLIVATIELVVCLGCAVVLWIQRRGMPDKSRLMLALGAAHCVVTSSLKLVTILASPTQHFYQETLPPSLTMWGMLSMLLLLAYPVTVARPEWFRSVGGVILFLLPGLLFMAVHLCIPSYHHLYSFTEMWQSRWESDVLFRLVQYPIIVIYSMILLLRMVNIRETGASSLWIRSYIVGALGLLTLASAFATFHIMPLHYLHQLCVAAFYAYWTYYELMERSYTVPSNTVPASVLDDADAVHQRFLHFDEQVDARRLYAQHGISRDDLCRVMGVDRTSFSRIIAEQSGCQNLADYLNRKRMAYAVELMCQHPNYTLQAIMTDCGFSNKMTFNRVFKETYGTTPSEYRQRLGKDA